MFETANVIFSVCLYFFQGYCLQYFYGSFLESRTKDGRWGGLAVAASYAVFRLALFWAVPSKSWDYRVEVWKMLLALCVLAVLAACFYKALHLITVFLVVAFQAVADISRYVTAILLGELGEGLLGLWNWLAGNGRLATEDAFCIAVNVGLAIQWIIECMVIALVLYLSLKKIVRDFREKEHGISRMELLFILTPAAVGLMLCVLLRIIMVTVEDGAARILYDRYPILLFVLPTILFLSLLSILYGVKLFQDMVCWNRERSSRIVLEKQVQSLQEHMEEMERINSGIRGMKHDMKNTLSVIQRLSAGSGADENPELQAYLEELNQTMDRLEFRFRTGNTVVDTLLNMKYHEITRMVPDLQMDVGGLQFPKKLFIQSYDIGIILGNALDNAMEACRKLKEKELDAAAFIRISSFQKRELFFLKVENSFDGRLVRKPQKEFPMTDKADRENHGIGLANIKSTAEKYQGTMDFKVKGRVFILSVMMKNERREEDGLWSDR